MNETELLSQLRWQQAGVVAEDICKLSGSRLPDDLVGIVAAQAVDGLATVQNQLFMLGLADAEYNRVCNRLQHELLLLVERSSKPQG